MLYNLKLSRRIIEFVLATEHTRTPDIIGS